MIGWWLRLRPTEQLRALRGALAAERSSDRATPEQRGLAQRRYSAVCWELERRSRRPSSARRGLVRTVRALLAWGLGY